MIESLRGLGYSTASALCDIIDNSISAKADYVNVQFVWQGRESTIAVIDNGFGMNEQELDSAMRLGERNPLDQRSVHDLGRFGMGLKTASFSQCRRVTVASRKDDTTHCFRWDLDAIAASPDDGWHLLEGPADESSATIELLNSQKRGTLVLWEKLDRVVTGGFTQQDFLDLIDKVEIHLAMIYHRFLLGLRPRLHLTINGRAVQAWDPFLKNHPATWSSPVEHISLECGHIEVQGYVLPHKDRLEAKEHQSGAGPEGWTAQQGFYVYRNERLLVAGGWLGLGRGRCWTNEESHRLARIRLDIPNSADAIWKIDVRKSIAQPPVSIRDRLTRLAEHTRERARRVFAHRGHTVRTGNATLLNQAWRAEHFKGGMRYRINTEHPAVRVVLDTAGKSEPQIRAMLRVIEETIPVQRIWLDTAEERETPLTGFAGQAPTEVAAVLVIVYRNLISRKGFSPAAARQRLHNTEPFHNYPDLVEALPDELPAPE